MTKGYLRWYEDPPDVTANGDEVSEDYWCEVCNQHEWDFVHVPRIGDRIEVLVRRFKKPVNTWLGENILLKVVSVLHVLETEQGSQRVDVFVILDPDQDLYAKRPISDSDLTRK